MKQHTILLVACLMTIPAVTAEGQDPCAGAETETCETVYIPDPLESSYQPATGGAPEASDCPLLSYWYEPGYLPSQPPLGATLNVQCITWL